MTLSTAPYKGTRDFYPEDMRFRRWMFGQLREAVRRFGYLEYDGPMLEPFDLYAAKTGEEIVNKQLFWLVDQGERKMAVRPEMTPTLARMVAAKLHELPRPIRWFSIPNLWRYERPQRGRLREHWQLNVDVLGGDPLLADAEILQVALGVMKAFGGDERIRVRVNHRGLMDAFFQKKMGLSSDVAHQTVKAIDAKDKIGQEAYEKWLREQGLKPVQIQELEKFFKMPFDEVYKQVPCEGGEHLRKLFAMLKESGIGDQVVFDPTIMRGLDYYTGTVFEVYDTSPENPRAMFGGGRYDNLVGLFAGGKESAQLPGVGFGMGDVTLQNFLETHKLIPAFESNVDVFVSLPSLALRSTAEKIAGDLRSAGLSVATPLQEGGFGQQLKQASKQGARFAVLLGDQELKDGKAVVKDLASGQQETWAIQEIAKCIQSKLSKSKS